MLQIIHTIFLPFLKKPKGRWLLIFSQPPSSTLQQQTKISGFLWFFITFKTCEIIASNVPNIDFYRGKRQRKKCILKLAFQKMCATKIWNFFQYVFYQITPPPTLCKQRSYFDITSKTVRFPCPCLPLNYFPLN